MGFLNKLFGNKTPQTSSQNFSERLIVTMSCFMDASMMHLSMGSSLGLDMLDTEEKRSIVYCFAFGALDCATQRNNVDMIQTHAYAAIFFVRYFRMATEEAGGIVGHCARMYEEPKYRPYFQAGGQALADWLSEKDIYAPLRLSDILSKIDKKTESYSGETNEQ